MSLIILKLTVFNTYLKILKIPLRIYVSKASEFKNYCGQYVVSPLTKEELSYL